MAGVVFVGIPGAKCFKGARKIEIADGGLTSPLSQESYLFLIEWRGYPFICPLKGGNVKCFAIEIPGHLLMYK